MGRHLRRKVANVLAAIISALMVILAVIPLFHVLFYVLRQGLPGLSWTFFTNIPAPTGVPGGGMGNAILGSLILVAIASLVSVPLGIGAGIFLSEWGRGRLGDLVRWVADILSGAPSIVVGIFIYSIVVVPMQGFSALSGGLALAVLMMPTVARSTEQMLRMVPMALREGSLALGANWAQTVWRVVMPAARKGILTGVMLAVARVMGETAPLIVTAFGSGFWPSSIFKPIAAVPLQVFVYAISPYPDWQQQAWTGALTLVLIVLVINIVARVALRDRMGVGR
ncbi:MAG: phosphate ABC transporter permease PstA [Kyrpidia tusciae]|nr:phosphate ABC transporter permease PstA [Kyrpidia tusciae]MBE3551856.1 phosphate ABC transporter permease PstA [Kyrpidia tusciae]